MPNATDHDTARVRLLLEDGVLLTLRLGDIARQPRASAKASPMRLFCHACATTPAVGRWSKTRHFRLFAPRHRSKPVRALIAKRKGQLSSFLSAPDLGEPASLADGPPARTEATAEAPDFRPDAAYTFAVSTAAQPNDLATDPVTMDDDVGDKRMVLTKPPIT